MSHIIKYENIESRIIIIREKRVLLDIDVAELYGVETKRINEAVKNNTDKFPDNYLKSKFLTSIKGGEVKIPNAFTEKGLYMLATILKSKTATQTTKSETTIELNFAVLILLAVLPINVMNSILNDNYLLHALVYIPLVPLIMLKPKPGTGTSTRDLEHQIVKN